MPGVGLAPGRPMAAENIRNLKRGTRHGRRRSRRRIASPLRLSRSKGLITLRISLGHPRIERRRVELRVAKQNLDDADIDILLQKMGRKTVPQRVQRTRLPISATWAAAWQMRFNWRVVSGLTGFCPETARLPACRCATTRAGYRAAWGKHGVAVLTPLALLDAQHHAGAVDVRDLQRHDFGRPEPRAIGDAQRSLVLGAGRGLRATRATSSGSSTVGARAPCTLNSAFQKPGLVERHAEKEPQRLLSPC